MTARRHLLLLTPSETNVARTALAYVVENAGSADYDGATLRALSSNAKGPR